MLPQLLPTSQFVQSARPRIYVDFSELLDGDLVWLSKTEVTADSDGNPVTLSEGMAVYVFQDDLDDEGRRDGLIADGIGERSVSECA